MTLGMVLSCRSQDTPLTMVLVPGHGWEKMASGMKFCDACCTDKQGNFYFADVFRWPSTDDDALTATAVSATCAILEEYSV